MEKLKIKHEDDGIRIFINDNEIESVRKLKLDLDAKRIPVATVEINVGQLDIENLINKKDIKIYTVIDTGDTLYKK